VQYLHVAAIFVFAFNPQEDLVAIGHNAFIRA